MRNLQLYCCSNSMDPKAIHALATTWARPAIGNDDMAIVKPCVPRRAAISMTAYNRKTKNIRRMNVSIEQLAWNTDTASSMSAAVAVSRPVGLIIGSMTTTPE